MLIDKIIFRLRKKQMLELAAMPHNELEPQSRFNNERFKFAFHDTEGNAYYEMADPNDMPIARKLYAANVFIKFHNCISDSDITLSLRAMKQAIENVDEKGKSKPEIARIGYICTTLLARQGTVLSKELLAEVAACYYIREDEAIGVVNEDILKQKVQTFSKESEKCVRLFYEQGFDKYFPFMKDERFLLDEIFKVSMVHLTSYTTELNSYLDGRRDFSKVSS